MVCKKCGKKVKGEPEICPRCGAPMKETVSLGAIHDAREARHKKKLTKKQLALRISLIVLASLLAVVIAVVTIMWATIASNIKPGSELSGDIAINSDLPTEGVQNIALFGLDTRQDNEVGHSDAIIIVSIDRTHNKIKMSSIARDSLVPIDGHNESKITHAFGWGGVNLAVKTVNQNFGMNIRDYAYVNFYEFAKLIDFVGGVDIDVSQKEMGEMNRHIKWIKSYGIKCDYVKKAGMQHLNGGQALAYSRVRKIDSDLARSNRQKEVLQAMFDEVKGLPLTKFPSLVSKVLGMCHTNMNSGELMSIATWALTTSPEIVNKTLPSDECNAWGGVHNPHGWVWIYDLDYATAVLHDFIYETNTAAGMSCSRYSGNGHQPVKDTTATPRPVKPTKPAKTEPALTTQPTATDTTGAATGTENTGTTTGSSVADPTVATTVPTGPSTATAPTDGKPTGEAVDPPAPKSDG